MKATPAPGWRCPKCKGIWSDIHMKPEEHVCVMELDEPGEAVERVELWRCGNCHMYWLDEEKAEACCDRLEAFCTGRPIQAGCWPSGCAR